MRDIQVSDVVNPPFLLCYFSTIDWLRKRGNIADIKKVFSVRVDFKTKWFLGCFHFAVILGVLSNVKLLVVCQLP